jgi:hypothetical protein
MKLLRGSVGFAFALLVCSHASALAATRILYASDWPGPTQIFALDPAGRLPTGQLTFERVAMCGATSLPCGFADPLPSPDGRYVAYREVGEPGALWLADADGRNARRISDETLDASFGPGASIPQRTYAVWSPNSRELAYRTSATGPHFIHVVDGRRSPSGRWLRGWPSPDRVVSPNRRWLATRTNNGIVLTNRQTKRSHILVHQRAFRLAWSPDSRALVYVVGSIDVDVAATGDVRVVTLAGVDRVLAHARGQVESVAWTKQPAGVAYRAPEPVDGIFAGGPIARIAADGQRVAYAACLNVFTWEPDTGTVTQLDAGPNRKGACIAPDRREEVYDLAVAGDSVAWGEKTVGLSFRWSVLQALVAPVIVRDTLATGTGGLGSNRSGGGGLAGAGATLLYSAWSTSTDPVSGSLITAATLFRATPSGCPCPAIASAAAPAVGPEVLQTPIIALDTDGFRVAALRKESLVLLDSFGGDILSIPAQVAAAQLIGDEVVVTVPHELRLYDTSSGTIRRAWPLPSASVGRDCRFYSEPRCPYKAELRLQDVAQGRAAYVLNGQLHLLRLDDGRDTTVGFGTEARFMDNGLVYADGARVRLLPFSSLP